MLAKDVIIGEKYHSATWGPGTVEKITSRTLTMYWAQSCPCIRSTYDIGKNTYLSDLGLSEPRVSEEKPDQ